MTNNTQNQTPQENGIIDNLAAWLKTNKKTVIAVAVTIVVIGGIFAIVDNLRDKAYQDQWSNLFMAEMAVANGGDPSSYAPLEDFANSSLSRVAVVHFDAFEKTGNNLSWCLALLDRNNNGVVISSICGQETERSYAKPIEDGRAPSGYKLTREEEQALSQAMRN